MRVRALLPLLLLASCARLHLEYAPGQVETTRDRGMVVAECPIAAQIGARVLREGGTAADAAVRSGPAAVSAATGASAAGGSAITGSAACLRSSPCPFPVCPG